MIRDNLNDLDGYREIIDLNREFIYKREEKIRNLEDDETKGIQKFPKSNREVIKSTLSTMVGYLFDSFIAEYSSGGNLKTLTRTHTKILNTMERSWNLIPIDDFSHGFNEAPYYTSDNYWQVMTLISTGVLLEVDDQDFDRIINIRDKVDTPDKLLDLLISHRAKREVSENQLKHNRYSGLLKAIETVDSLREATMLSKYLSSKWFQEYKNMGWPETHKSKWNVHSGYWSFESGAIAKILTIDDESLNGQQYYPYDLVHYKTTMI